MAMIANMCYLMNALKLRQRLLLVEISQTALALNKQIVLIQENLSNVVRATLDIPEMD
jgi:hypothetical protein